MWNAMNYIYGAMMFRSYLRLRAMKNIYNGGRCFVIGNGPSLRNEDLRMLKNETTFACKSLIRI